MINVAEVFFITKTLLSSALTYGLVGASFGAGNIAGAVAASRLKQDDVALARASLASLIVVSVLVGLIGLVEHVGYLYPILVVMGIAVGVVNVASTTLMTVRTPEAQRGRMFSASNAAFTSAEILVRSSADSSSPSWPHVRSFRSPASSRRSSHSSSAPSPFGPREVRRATN